MGRDEQQRPATEQNLRCVQVIGLLGIYSDPGHVVYYDSDGETRQEYEVILLGRPSAVSRPRTTRRPRPDGSPRPSWTGWTSTRRSGGSCTTGWTARTPASTSAVIQGWRQGGTSVVTLADAVPGDEAAIAALCAELDEFYGSLPEGLPAERAAQVRDVLFGNPPLAYTLVAWDGEAPAGFATYSFLWPAVGLTASLYLKELYVAEAYRRTGVGRLLMDGLYDVARRRGLSRVARRR
jgi:GNAT superfamily N-acetyltransferase